MMASGMDQDPKESNREEALFQAALKLTGPERAAFLCGACLGDPALRQRLEELLVAEAEKQGAATVKEDDRGARVEEDTTEITRNPPNATLLGEAPGRLIGRYKLLEKLAEGRLTACRTVVELLV
jgi:hypothetical protein